MSFTYVLLSFIAIYCYYVKGVFLCCEIVLLHFADVFGVVTCVLEMFIAYTPLVSEKRAEKD